MPTGNLIFDELSGITWTLTDEGVQPVPSEPKKSKKAPEKVLDLQRLRYELEDCLEYILKGQNMIIERQYISVEQTIGNQHFEHRYQRIDAENRKMYYLYFKGQAIALVTRKPHKTALIYRQTTALHRLIKGVLVQTLYSQFPEVKQTEKR